LRGARSKTVSPEEPAEEICKRMAELRRELVHDMQEVSRSAKAMASPAFYVRKFPWATLAVAAGVGYMLIPKKKQQVMQPDMEALAELMRKNHVDVNASQAKDSPGMIKTLAAMGLTWAAKAGMNYVIQQATTAATKAMDPAQAPSSPVDEPTDVTG